MTELNDKAPGVPLPPPHRYDNFAGVRSGGPDLWDYAINDPLDIYYFDVGVAAPYTISAACANPLDLRLLKSDGGVVAEGITRAAGCRSCFNRVATTFMSCRPLAPRGDRTPSVTSRRITTFRVQVGPAPGESQYDSVNAFGDRDDVWAFPLEAGKKYTFSLYRRGQGNAAPCDATPGGLVWGGVFYNDLLRLVLHSPSGKTCYEQGLEAQEFGELTSDTPAQVLGGGVRYPLRVSLCPEWLC